MEYQPESMELYVNDTIPNAPSASMKAWKRMPSFFDKENIARQRWSLSNGD